MTRRGVGLTAAERFRLTLFKWRWNAQHAFTGLAPDRRTAEHLAFLRWLVRTGRLGEDV